MSWTEYLLGLALLAVIAAPLAFASWRWRGRLVPEWSGARARLVEIVLFLAALCVISELLGAIGGFRLWPLALTCLAAGAGAAITARRPGRPTSAGFDRVTVGTVIVFLLTALVVAQWSTRVFEALDVGPVDADTQIYHLPHAARFVQDGWLTRFHYTNADDANPYHPSNAELLHAVGMLAFHRDFLSIWINLGWLSIALLASWCLGRPYDAGPACTAGALLILATPLMAISQPGSANTDVVALSLLLATVALLVNARGRRSVIAVAGLAAGLALGTKLTMIVPIVILSLGIVWLAPKAGFRRTHLAMAWFLPLMSTGSFWYLRNLVRVGNPIPSLHLGLGGFSFPRPSIASIDQFGYSVADYAFDAGVWRQAFLPGLTQAFGPAWPVLFGLALLGLALAIFHRREPMLRLLGIAGLVSGISYVFTPTTALGPPGHPELFAANLRYLVPALMLGLSLLALIPRLSGKGAARTLFAFVLFFPFIASASGAWPAGYRRTAIAAGLFFLASFTMYAWVRRHRSSRPAIVTCLAALFLVGASAGGYALQTRYFNGRYAGASSPPSMAFAWARNVRDARIGYADFFIDYPLYGNDLSNRVEYIGDLRKDGSFVNYRTCASWRRAVNAGRYDYMVVMPAFDYQPEPLSASWTRTDAAAAPIVRSGRVSVFRINGLLDPSSCVQ